MMHQPFLSLFGMNLTWHLNYRGRGIYKISRWNHIPLAGKAMERNMAGERNIAGERNMAGSGYQQWNVPWQGGTDWVRIGVTTVLPLRSRNIRALFA